MRREVAIVGAGITGLAIAFELLRHGWRVQVWEARKESERTQATSFAAGGMLAPYSELESVDEPVFRLGCEALTLWPSFLADLPNAPMLEQKGSLLLSHPRDQAFLQHLMERISELAPAGSYAWVAAQELEPELTRSFGRGLWLPSEAHIEAPALLDALSQYVGNHPAAQLCFGKCVDDLRPGAVLHQGGWQSFPMVVDCRGYGAASELSQLRAVRGEGLLLHAPQVTLRRPLRLMHPRYAVYIIPRSSDRYYVGASSIESDNQDPITVRSTLELLSAAYSIHTGFGEATIMQTYCGLRPAFPNNTPRIMADQGLVRVNGLYRHGFLLAPMIAQRLRLWLDSPDEVAHDPLFALR